MAGVLLRPVQQTSDVALARAMAAGRLGQPDHFGGAVSLGALAVVQARRFFRRRVQPACGQNLRGRAAEMAVCVVAKNTARKVMKPIPLIFQALLIGSLSVAAADNVQTNTVLAEHITQLQKKVPPGFTIVAQPPFVVIGDELPEVVRRRSTNTVKWAVDKLKQDYFQRDPPEIIDIWLFRDNASYTNHARLLFNDTPTSPFGYYSAGHRALIMNISTGGGTLVHEIVHPFMVANFPGCPTWFNEGLASLYEASAERNGHIQGLINWRFKGLEQAIKDGKTDSFQQLTLMTGAEFYGGANGTNYSQHYA